jgi:hypothetical protein
LTDPETKLIADALYEIRTVLSMCLGSENDAPTAVRFEAHLAYAPHNEAAALAEGTSFDVNDALRKVAAIDGVIGGEDGKRLAHLWAKEQRLP